MNRFRYRLISWLSSILPKRAEQSESTHVVSSWLQSPKPGTDEEWQVQLQKCREMGRVTNNPKETQGALQLLDKKESVVRLPLHLEPQRVAPNAILRSALFGVVRRGKRRFIDGNTPLLVSAWSGSSIKYFGMQLDQYDLDVWLQALHIMRQQDLSDTTGIHFTARSFLSAMGRKYSGNAAQILFSSLRRMVVCAVTIKVGPIEYTGSLIEEFVRHEPTGLYVIRLNPRLKTLFDAGNTKLDWVTRLSLPTDLSRWMHGYVLSHKATKSAPHRIGIKTIRDLSGSTTADLWKFKQLLRRAIDLLAELKAVTTWRFTEGDALEFVRPNPSLKELPNLLLSQP